MSCCKAKEHSWCKDLPIVNYKDKEGKEYCAFHAPQGKKGISVEEFNNLISKRIKQDKKCNLSGTIFEDINFKQFNKDNPLPDIDFYRSTFSGTTHFGDVVFRGGVFFRFYILGKNIFHGSLI